MKAEINAKFSAINTKFSDLDAKFFAINTKFSDLETRLMDRMDGRLDAVESRIKDFVRESNHDLKTKLITEFHKWGSTSDMRTKQALSTTAERASHHH